MNMNIPEDTNRMEEHEVTEGEPLKTEPPVGSALQDNGSSEERKDETEKEYPVIHETVKKRPVKFRRIIQPVLITLAGAILFGIVAAFVFARFLPLFQTDSAETVQFEQDPVPDVTSPDDVTGTDVPEADETQVPEATETEKAPTGDEEPENTETSVPEKADPTETEERKTEQTGDGQTASGDGSETVGPNEIPEPIQTSAPDPARESAERIRQNRLLYNDLRMVSTQTARAVVTVTGITTTEDWFNTTSEERHQTTGVIVADNGISYLVLAQYEAIADSTSLYVTLFNNAIVECSLIKEDLNTGLAVLRVQKNNIDQAVRKDLQIAKLGNSYNIGNGEPVIAIGAPMGYTGAVDYGQITSISEKVSVMDAAYALIMTNIQGTASGSGVLIDLDGEVIGIISQQFSEGTNTITALPISPLKRTIEILSNNQKFAWLGIVGEDVTTRLSASFDIPVGIYVTEVAPDSPAFTAGIQRGDIICRIGESSVTEMAALGSMLNNGMAGTTQTIAVQRLGADGYVEIELEVSIGEI